MGFCEKGSLKMRSTGPDLEMFPIHYISECRTGIGELARGLRTQDRDWGIGNEVENTGPGLGNWQGV